MPLQDLTAADKAVVRTCLDYIAAGDLIRHDQEFPTIMGVSVAEFLAVRDAWPAVDESDEGVQCAIGNGLNNLLGYPHPGQTAWDAWTAVPKSEVARVLALWRGRAPTSYLDGLM